MKKGYKIAMWSTIAVATLGLSYWGFTAVRNYKLKKDAEKKTDETLPDIISSPPKANEFPMGATNYGFKSDKVMALQVKLNNAFSVGLTTDGIWGKKTHNVVKEKLNKDSIKDNTEYAKIISDLSSLSTTAGTSLKSVYAKEDTYIYSSISDVAHLSNYMVGSKRPKGTYLGKEVEKIMLSNNVSTWTKISYNAGYFDQPGYVLTKDIRY